MRVSGSQHQGLPCEVGVLGNSRPSEWVDSGSLLAGERWWYGLFAAH